MLHTQASIRAGFGALAAVLLIAGCGGAEFGETVTVPQEKHTPVDEAFLGGKALHFPADKPFNVTDFQRYASGDADATASTEASGKAKCTAHAGAGGSAWSEFELGQVLTQRGTKPFEATVTFNVAYSYRMAGEMSARTGSPDKFGLKVYIMDSNRRVLKRMMLAELDATKGPTAWSGTQAPAFDVTLEPGLAYHLVLAARMDVSGDENRAPAAEIDVKSLTIDVVPKS